MAAIGGNVRRDGSIDLTRLKSLNQTWIRIVATPDHDLSGYFQQARELGIKTLLVFARESGEDYLKYYRMYGQLVDAVQVGNEPDLSSPSSWTMSQSELTALGRRVREAWPRPFPLVVGGLASGHPEWLDGVDLSWADAIGVHPYAKDSENSTDIEDQPDAQPLLREYRRFGLPIVVTEWGWPSDEEPRASEEVRDMVSWAARTDEIEAFFYFAVHDDVHPFGLWKQDGSNKPKARAFREAAAGAVHSTWPASSPPADLRQFARDVARRYGWQDPELFVRQIQQESGFNPNAHNARSGADGIAQIIERYHPEMRGRTQDPYASMDYAARWGASLYARYGTWAKALAAYNWGPGNVDSWDGRRSSLPAETRLYLDRILGPNWESGAILTRVRYNPNEPAHPQEETFDCSQEALEWALWSYGRRPTDEWLESTMIAEGVMSPDVGLRDASGRGLAEFVRRHYQEFGYDANHEPGSSPGWTSLTFDMVAAEAGSYPLLIGGRAWNHWSGVRGYDRVRDVLLLANPSNGHMGIQQEMTRAQFSNLGPFSMVRVLHKDILEDLSPSPPPPPPPPPRTRETVVREIRGLVGQVQKLVDELAGWPS